MLHKGPWTDVSVIIVNWNSREYLRRCLASIRAETRDLAVEIVVIDSASFDGADVMLREEYPDVRFIQSSTNLGFARANNCAFRQSSGKFVLFLNPDTELVGPAINVLHGALAARDDAGTVGAKLLNSDGSIQTTCIRALPTITNRILDCDLLRSAWPTSRLWGMAPLYQANPGVREVQAISGACVMVRREVFEQAGLFSEDYFMYAEDMDLSYKVRQLGYRNYYVPDAVVVHHGGSSSIQTHNRFAAVMIPEATWRFLRKTRGNAYALTYRLALLGSAIGRIGLLQILRALDRRKNRSSAWEAAVAKWAAIVRWSLNRDPMVKEYYRKHLEAPGFNG
jgi:GT2 family glycosyltransferase